MKKELLEVAEKTMMVLDPLPVEIVNYDEQA